MSISVSRHCTCRPPPARRAAQTLPDGMRRHQPRHATAWFTLADVHVGRTGIVPLYTALMMSVLTATVPYA